VKDTETGSVSVLPLVLLFWVTALILSLATLAHQTALMTAQGESQGERFVETEDLLEGLRLHFSQWEGPHSPLSSPYQKALELPGVLEIREISSGIPLNLYRSTLMEKTPFSSLFITPEGFRQVQVKRLEEGGFLNVSGLENYLETEALESFFTLVSWINPQTSDEFMAEKMVASWTGDTDRGAYFYQQMREHFLSGTPWSKEEIPRELIPLVSLMPWWNVNFLPEPLLAGLLEYQGWKIEDSSRILGEILEQRQVHPLSREDLQKILSVPSTHRFFQYLGDTSGSWQFLIETPSGDRALGTGRGYWDHRGQWQFRIIHRRYL